MNFHSLRSLLSAVLMGFAAFLLVSCGGGGASGNPNVGGSVSISPGAGTIYAGVPVTFSLQGGRAPYALTSSEPLLLPVPAIVSENSFTTIPNNPGVLDAGLQPGDLPVRTVLITVRDSIGTVVTTSGLKVAVNYLTAYGISFTASNCPSGSATGANPGAQACAGGATAVQFRAVTNGNAIGNKQFRIEVLRGNFSLRSLTGQVTNSLVVTSDHTGLVSFLIDVPPNVPTQLAAIRIVDVATGVYSDTVFTINALSQSQIITPIPNAFTFTGVLNTQCGTGTADFLVFNGVPPYTAVTDFTNAVRVVSQDNPNSNVSNTEPGRFRVEAFNPNFCVAPATVTITDARGGRATVTVTTVLGSTAPPAPIPLAVGPSSLTLGCGQTGSVVVIGGRGGYFTTSTSPNVVAQVSGNIVSITRNGPAGPGTGGTQAVGIGITDGAAIVTVTATVPTSCP